MKELINIEGCEIPRHIAIIMDGNGRWALNKGKTRQFGHKQGSKVLKRVCKEAYDLGIKYITIFAFSTENWKRPRAEVDYLMQLLRHYLKDSIVNARKDNMKVRVLGDRENLDIDIKKRIEELEESSKGNNGVNLQIALNYGGRNEIIRTIKKIMRDHEKNRIKINELDETIFEKYLDTVSIPEPDLLIRTSGEKRLSNFLLWQLAYTEFYFTNKNWPDFTIEDIKEAILYYNKKERRFGGI